MKEKKLRDKALIKEIYQAMISNKLEEFIDNHEINYSYAHLVQNYADKIGKKNFAFNKYFKSYSFNLKRKIIKNIESLMKSIIQYIINCISFTLPNFSKKINH